MLQSLKLILPYEKDHKIMEKDVVSVQLGSSFLEQGLSHSNGVDIEGKVCIPKFPSFYH